MKTSVTKNVFFPFSAKWSCELLHLEKKKLKFIVVVVVMAGHKAKGWDYATAGSGISERKTSLQIFVMCFSS